MKPAPHLLSDLHLFVSAGEEREAALQALVGALGPSFQLVPERLGEWSLPLLHHGPTSVSFAVVPGGTFEMGLTEEDVEHAIELLDWTPGVAAFVERLKSCARPVRRVSVEPFLCAVEPLAVAQALAWTEGRYTRDTFEDIDVARWIASVPGFRLPSEAELEYLARDGVQQTFVYDAVRAFDEGAWPRRGRFGVRRLTDNEWTADDWHEDYARAPGTGVPWGTGAGPRVYRGLLPDGPRIRSELVLTLAAARGKAREPHDPDFQRTRFLCARPVLSLAELLG